MPSLAVMKMAKKSSKKRRKRRRIRKLPLLVLIVSVLILVFASCLGLVWWHYTDSQKPVQANSEQVKFVVDDGDNLRTVTTKLEDAGLIKDAKMAYYYVRLNKINSLYAGTYMLDKSWDLATILDYVGDFSNTEQDHIVLTIIEGDWAKDIAKRIEAATGISAESLMELWNDRGWIEAQRERYPFITDEMFNDGVRIYLEGYLFPSTYFVNPEADRYEVTYTLLDQTLAIYRQFQEQIEGNELSTHQIFTLASIVQYEAGGSEEDQRTIAGVFYNRLRIGMALQSSVTVCYAIDFDKEVDNWTACEVNSSFESPYNTYMYPGLPPGPIDNPGAASFNSVLNPIESNYYYFMADVCGDGKIYYAESLADHNANVARYLTPGCLAGN